MTMVLRIPILPLCLLALAAAPGSPAPVPFLTSAPVPGDGPVPGAWWVFLSDRGPDPAPRLSARLAELEELGCVERRLSRGSADAVGPGDLAPWSGYVAAIERIAAVRVLSRYLNAVSVMVEDWSTLRELAGEPFVAGLRPVSSSRITPLEPPEGGFTPEPGLLSEGQLSQIGLSGLHERGWAGQGVIVGVLDSGFNLYHPCFSATDILDEYDFVGDDSVTAFEEGDPPTAGLHGCGVLSLIGGYEEGMYSGGAPAASFLLMRTEDSGDEYQQEEDFWVAGLEWAEERGADVVSSSLGYIDWYGYEDMDGNTAVTTVAADSAATRGLLVVNAMGNEGPAPGTLIAPADGDMVLSIGAVSSLGEIVDFSSRGPTYDGRIKPEVVARGYYTMIANYESYSGYFGRNGTSYATPLVTSVVALLIEQHPSWDPGHIIAALRATSSRASSPDNDYGWGVVDATLAIGRESITGRVRRSDDGSPLAAYPLDITVEGDHYGVTTNEQGWFLLEPAQLGAFSVSDAGGAGQLLEQAGELDSAGVELELFVDTYTGQGEPDEPVLYPNPCIASGGDRVVYVGFDLARASDVTLTVFSVDARPVYTVTRTGLEPGEYRAPVEGEAFCWDWTDGDGAEVSSGIYLFVLEDTSGASVLKGALAK